VLLRPLLCYRQGLPAVRDRWREMSTDYLRLRKQVHLDYGKRTGLDDRSVLISAEHHTASVIAYRVIVLSICRNRSKHVHRMIANSVLGHHTTPIAHICIVAECQDPGIGDPAWQHCRWPWVNSAFRLPCVYPIACQTMYKDDTGERLVIDKSGSGRSLLDSGILRFVKQLKTRVKSLPRCCCESRCWRWGRILGIRET
jgi:hypothetical protein